jgi:hypothetical protein
MRWLLRIGSWGVDLVSQSEVGGLTGLSDGDEGVVSRGSVFERFEQFHDLYSVELSGRFERLGRTDGGSWVRLDGWRDRRLRRVVDSRMQDCTTSGFHPKIYFHN